MDRIASERNSENYRNGYPGREDDPNLTDNLKFYRSEIESTPDGACIDEILSKWYGDYRFLERHQGFIQWLFPIREGGMNCHAKPLQLHEAEAIKADPKAHKRFLEAYKMMLDFYGMKLVDEATGRLERSENWRQRFEYLNWSSNNYMRITRMLKSLGELGYEHLKKGFIQLVLVEALEYGTLDRALNSCRDYWIGTIRSDKIRNEFYNYIDDHMSVTER
uniref:Opioid growth factor receptor (OGFr) conserved domain-containing protein n=2 Tax=Arion vulgaris TaxID=1028688 RepID=A0A0B7B733_9EUPU